MGGNHCSTSGRDSGLVLIQTQLVRQKFIVYLWNVLANAAGDAIRVYDVLADSITTSNPLSKLGRQNMKSFLSLLHVVFSLLVIANYQREPSPRSTTKLPDFSLIRTRINVYQFGVQSVNGKRWSQICGGVEFVRKKMFENSALSNNDNVHFLLTSAHGHRYQNKLLKGSQKLIESQLPVHLPELSDR